MFSFLNLEKSYRTYGVDFKIEQLRKFICKLCTFFCIGFCGAVPTPYDVPILYIMYRRPC